MVDKHEPKTKKLMAAHEKREFNQLDDFLFTVAESIEEAFLRARNRATTATCSRWPRHLPLSNGRKICW